MILTCEECHTRYLVPGHAVGPEGRRVRCTSCGHEWFVAPEEDEDVVEPEDIEPIPESVKPVPEGSEVPAIRQNVLDATDGQGRWGGYAGALAVFVLVLGLLVALHGPLVKAWPASVAIYGLIGLATPVEGEALIFDNITARVTAENGMQVLTVEGTVMNLQPAPSSVPLIQASLMLDNGEVVDRWLVEPSADVIQGHAEATFSSTYPEVPVDVRGVNVRLLAGEPMDVPQEHPEAAKAPSP